MNIVKTKKDLELPSTVSNKEILMDRENVINSDLFEVAKIETRETTAIRNESLRQLRIWIEQNPDIENCFIDDSFLLRFLRVRKYSLPMAQQTLLKYLNFRQKFKHIMCNLDYTQPGTLDLINRGYVYVSPFRDRNGRRVIIYDIGRIDVNVTVSEDILRADAVTFETLLEDEETQIMGVTHIIQATGVGPSYVPLFHTSDFGYLIKWGEQSFPMRHHSFIVTNVSSIIKYVYELTKTLISAKLRNRITMDDNLQKLHDRVGKKCLPLELGGIIPENEMMALWKVELESKRNRLLSLDKMRLLSDKGIITSRSRHLDATGIGSVAGSFRKLDID